MTAACRYQVLPGTLVPLCWYTPVLGKSARGGGGTRVHHKSKQWVHGVLCWQEEFASHSTEHEIFTSNDYVMIATYGIKILTLM